MKYEAFRDLAEGMPTFTKRDVVTLSGQSAASMAVNLNRWLQAGRIERLRRGLYTLNDKQRQAPLTAAYLASVLVEPSYLSGVWVLSQNSVIAEAVFTVTAATRGRKVRFENAYGRFAYYRLPERAWFGYSSQELHGYFVLLANSEKALLDAIYWSDSVWDQKRFRQERVDASRINVDRLSRYVQKWGDLKLKRSILEFKIYKEDSCQTW